jgi:predicted ArsR family transcriptional regulator
MMADSVEFRNTRSRVVDALRRGPQTLDELVEQLGLTRTALRLQIATLERDGRVVRSGIRTGRTKPAHVYRLTDRAEQDLSRAYVPVLTALLHVLSSRLSSIEFDAVMRDVGRGLLAEVAKPRGDLKTRVGAASALLNQLGGLTGVEERGPNLVIQAHGCPLAATAAHHPETCSAMESLVSEFVGARVTQRCDRTGRPRCCFQIAADEPAA